ncbi:PHP domain-containing protein [Halieaceae bacterium IMCC14734]|uniref:PHP domain-containing protein n=1 Tax=Candidatus Litorirhabdus singularis TaxID=2518993 RepID=A0ABT3TFS6_9GAMM|nr:PHP domain-containing protein [Candidatus Litorirhabdus singularis]MCX2981157.1 PHP domain-containing protein [Candidatus Litorirhabdus singularis]
MIIDFHCHSNASDGALSPLELWEAAADAGVEQFAVTDHDTLAGYLQLREQAPASSMQLRSGAELSCVWSKTTVHIVGLDFDAEHAAMQEAMQLLQQARVSRAEAIAERLQKCGFSGALEGAQRHAGSSQLGRPHFAAWMVEQGHSKDMGSAFDKYLGAGKVGDVKAFWPNLEQAVQWIVAAGGVAILAHPLKYRFTNMKLRRLLEAFCASGGSAIEVYSGRQSEDRTRYLGKLATDFELLMSAGSDFHRTFEYGPRLGVDVERLPPGIGLWSQA